MFSICVRRVRNNRFDDEPVIGPTAYLDVPDGTNPAPAHRISRTEWLRRLLATFNPGPGGVGLFGDLTVYVHGYNNSIATVAHRHRLLQDNLAAAGFSTTVVSFDWPSGTVPIGYLEDRHDAMVTAMRLVTDGIRVMLGVRRPDCEVNIHIVAHSMGAYVVREAFEDADNSRAADQNWQANQVVLVAGDVSAGSLSGGNPTSDSLYRHAGRITNYYNRHDVALQVSNVKRLGLSPRVGRVGLPVTSPAVDVDCSQRFVDLQGRGALPEGSNPSHTFYFGDPLFYRDLAATLMGRVDRAALPTRVAVTGDGPSSFLLV
ncbi:MAG: alpha/beta hydrolase [Gemmobacter sp.]